jgi:hypothetical protein
MTFRARAPVEGVRAVGASGLSAGGKPLQLGRTFSGPQTHRNGADCAAPSNQAQQHRKHFLYVIGNGVPQWQSGHRSPSMKRGILR